MLKIKKPSVSFHIIHLLHKSKRTLTKKIVLFCIKGHISAILQKFPLKP